MRIAYLDCFAGISGDMMLGALVDAGADFDELSGILQRLPIEPFELRHDRVEVQGVRAARVHVRAPEASVIRTYASIRQTLDAADVPDDARHISQRIFRRLAEAEARVHGKDIDLVTFHEIGALDSIVDIVGVAVGLSLLGVERVYSSPVPTGFGMHRTEHGLTPIPSPSVVELLRGAPMFSRGVPAELVTPTGAAILAAVAEGYGDMPPMRVEAVGYGAGTHRLDFPDVLRLMVGLEEPTREARVQPAPQTDRVLLEALVSDLNPELYRYVLDRLRASGADDAWLGRVVRPDDLAAVSLSALCTPDRVEVLKDVLFAETGAEAIRSRDVLEERVSRELLKVETVYGPVGVRVGRRGGRVVSVTPDLHECARLARETGAAAKDVHAEAERLAREQLAR